MIKLELADYCENCPNLYPEAIVEQIDSFSGERTFSTTITCESRLKCAAMYECIKKEINKEDERRTKVGCN